MARKVLFVMLLRCISSIVSANDAHIRNQNCVKFSVADIEKYMAGLNLATVPSVETMIAGYKCPVSALPFGALKSDWARLMLLHDAQPPGTILREKLRHLYRLLIVAYYRMEEKFNTFKPTGGYGTETSTSSNVVEPVPDTVRMAMSREAKSTRVPSSIKPEGYDDKRSQKPVTTRPARKKFIESDQVSSESSLDAYRNWLASIDATKIRSKILIPRGRRRRNEIGDVSRKRMGRDSVHEPRTGSRNGFGTARRRYGNISQIERPEVHGIHPINGQDVRYRRVSKSRQNSFSTIRPRVRNPRTRKLHRRISKTDGAGDTVTEKSGNCNHTSERRNNHSLKRRRNPQVMSSVNDRESQHETLLLPIQPYESDHTEVAPDLDVVTNAAYLVNNPSDSYESEPVIQERDVEDSSDVSDSDEPSPLAITFQHERVSTSEIDDDDVGDPIPGHLTWRPYGKNQSPLPPEVVSILPPINAEPTTEKVEDTTIKDDTDELPYGDYRTSIKPWYILPTRHESQETTASFFNWLATMTEATTAAEHVETPQDDEGNWMTPSGGIDKYPTNEDWIKPSDHVDDGEEDHNWMEPTADPSKHRRENEDKDDSEEPSVEFRRPWYLPPLEGPPNIVPPTDHPIEFDNQTGSNFNWLATAEVTTMSPVYETTTGAQEEGEDEDWMRPKGATTKPDQGDTNWMKPKDRFDDDEAVDLNWMKPNGSTIVIPEKEPKADIPELLPDTEEYLSNDTNDEEPIRIVTRNGRTGDKEYVHQQSSSIIPELMSKRFIHLPTVEYDDRRNNRNRSVDDEYIVSKNNETEPTHSDGKVGFFLQNSGYGHLDERNRKGEQPSYESDYRQFSVKRRPTLNVKIEFNRNKQRANEEYVTHKFVADIPKKRDDREKDYQYKDSGDVFFDHHDPSSSLNEHTTRRNLYFKERSVDERIEPIDESEQTREIAKGERYAPYKEIEGPFFEIEGRERYAPCKVGEGEFSENEKISYSPTQSGRGAIRHNCSGVAKNKCTPKTGNVDIKKLNSTNIRINIHKGSTVPQVATVKGGIARGREDYGRDDIKSTSFDKVDEYDTVVEEEATAVSHEEKYDRQGVPSSTFRIDSAYKLHTEEDDAAGVTNSRKDQSENFGSVASRSPQEDIPFTEYDESSRWFKKNTQSNEQGNYFTSNKELGSVPFDEETTMSKKLKTRSTVFVRPSMMTSAVTKDPAFAKDVEEQNFTTIQHNSNTERDNKGEETIVPKKLKTRSTISVQSYTMTSASTDEPTFTEAAENQNFTYTQHNSNSEQNYKGEETIMPEKLETRSTNSVLGFMMASASTDESMFTEDAEDQYFTDIQHNSNSEQNYKGEETIMPENSKTGSTNSVLGSMMASVSADKPMFTEDTEDQYFANTQHNPNSERDSKGEETIMPEKLETRSTNSVLGSMMASASTDKSMFTQDAEDQYFNNIQHTSSSERKNKGEKTIMREKLKTRSTSSVLDSMMASASTDEPTFTEDAEEQYFTNVQYNTNSERENRVDETIMPEKFKTRSTSSVLGSMTASASTDEPAFTEDAEDQYFTGTQHNSNSERDNREDEMTVTAFSSRDMKNNVRYDGTPAIDEGSSKAREEGLVMQETSSIFEKHTHEVRRSTPIYDDVYDDVTEKEDRDKEILVSYEPSQIQKDVKHAPQRTIAYEKVTPRYTKLGTIEVLDGEEETDPENGKWTTQYHWDGSMSPYQPGLAQIVFPGEKRRPPKVFEDDKTFSRIPEGHIFDERDNYAKNDSQSGNNWVRGPKLSRAPQKPTTEYSEYVDVSEKYNYIGDNLYTTIGIDTIRDEDVSYDYDKTTQFFTRSIDPDEYTGVSENGIPETSEKTTLVTMGRGGIRKRLHEPTERYDDSDKSVTTTVDSIDESRNTVDDTADQRTSPVDPTSPIPNVIPLTGSAVQYETSTDRVTPVMSKEESGDLQNISPNNMTMETFMIGERKLTTRQLNDSTQEVFTTRKSFTTSEERDVEGKYVSGHEEHNVIQNRNTEITVSTTIAPSILNSSGTSSSNEPNEDSVLTSQENSSPIQGVAVSVNSSGSDYGNSSTILENSRDMNQPENMIETTDEEPIIAGYVLEDVNEESYPSEATTDYVKESTKFFDNELEGGLEENIPSTEEVDNLVMHDIELLETIDDNTVTTTASNVQLESKVPPSDTTEASYSTENITLYITRDTAKESHSTEHITNYTTVDTTEESYSTEHITNYTTEDTTEESYSTENTTNYTTGSVASPEKTSVNELVEDTDPTKTEDINPDINPVEGVLRTDSDETKNSKGVTDEEVETTSIRYETDRPITGSTLDGDSTERSTRSTDKMISMENDVGVTNKEYNLTITTSSTTEPLPKDTVVTYVSSERPDLTTTLKKNEGHEETTRSSDYTRMKKSSIPQEYTQTESSVRTTTREVISQNIPRAFGTTTSSTTQRILEPLKNSTFKTLFVKLPRAEVSGAHPTTKYSHILKIYTKSPTGKEIWRQGATTPSIFANPYRARHPDRRREDAVFLPKSMLHYGKVVLPGPKRRGGPNTDLEKLYRWFYKQGRKPEESVSRDTERRPSEAEIKCKNEKQ